MLLSILSTQADWLLAIGLCFGLFGLVFIVELLAKKTTRASWRIRTFVHISTGLFVLPALFFFDDPLPLIVLAGGFALLYVWSIYNYKF